MKLNLKDSVLDEKGKEEFLQKSINLLTFSVLEMSIYRGTTKTKR